jgi:hypothetical protein
MIYKTIELKRKEGGELVGRKGKKGSQTTQVPNLKV